MAGRPRPLPPPGIKGCGTQRTDDGQPSKNEEKIAGDELLLVLQQMTRVRLINDKKPSDPRGQAAANGRIQRRVASRRHAV